MSARDIIIGLYSTVEDGFTGRVPINYLSDLADCNPENDNLDVHVLLDDGREFTFTVATPNNIFCCMENEGTDYFFGDPMVFVKSLTNKI
jgi:hypothetical protein